MVGLGVLGALGALLLARPMVEADERRIRVRNVFGRYDLPWTVVRAVRFDRGAFWASLELADDDVVPVMAVQRIDKDHAVASVRGLRALHAASVDPAGGDSAQDSHRQQDTPRAHESDDSAQTRG